MLPVYLADLAWPDVEEQLARDDRLILVTGATEQHGRHLPLATDCIIPVTIAARLSARTLVPIAPVVNYGMSESHMAFPGTFTLSEETLRALYLELVQSAYRQGWRRLLVLNGHGGNKAAWRWATALATKIKDDLRITVTHWWEEEMMTALVRQATGRNEGHAGLEETAAVIAARPHLVKASVAEGTENAPAGIWQQSPEAIRAALPSGAIGRSPGEATANLGEQLLDLLVREYELILEGDWM